MSHSSDSLLLAVTFLLRQRPRSWHLPISQFTGRQAGLGLPVVAESRRLITGRSCWELRAVTCYRGNLSSLLALAFPLPAAGWSRQGATCRRSGDAAISKLGRETRLLRYALGAASPVPTVAPASAADPGLPRIGETARIPADPDLTIQLKQWTAGAVINLLSAHGQEWTHD